MFCDHCGERYREVWKAGRLRPLLYSNNQLHSCKGSRQEMQEAIKNKHGGNGRKTKRKGGTFRKPLPTKQHSRLWTVEDKANEEADARLAHLMEAA